MPMPSNVKKYFLVLFLSLSVLAFSPRIAHIEAATEYELLAPIPLDDVTNAANPTNKVTPQTYIEGIVKLTIAAAGVIAVLKLIAAGLRYVAVDSFSGKDTAKNEINHALIGLILAIGAFTILNTISTQFTKLTISPQTVGTSTQLTDGAICDDIYASLDNGKCLCTVTGEEREAGKPCPTPSSAARPGIGCDLCSSINHSIPSKPPGKAGDQAAGCVARTATETKDGPCVVDATLGHKLYYLAEFLRDDFKLDWQVTEMFPPTVPHDDDCHKPGTSQSGQCVDASLRSPLTAQNLLKFMYAVTFKVGPNWQFETSDPDAIATMLRSYASSHGDDFYANDTEKYIKKLKKIGSTSAAKATAQHMHINYP